VTLPRGAPTAHKTIKYVFYKAAAPTGLEYPLALN
jgi:hypothetical protein